VCCVPYQITDFLTTVNKGTALPTGTPANAIYTQTGINLAKFTLNIQGQYSSEIAGALHLTGGQLWEYDGVKPVEDGFQVWPENVRVTTATGSGSIAAGTYNYVAVYEWTDNQGNVHRSTPSIPVTITLTSKTAVAVTVPTLRLTYKISISPVVIEVYRWSAGQETFYEATLQSNIIMNDPTAASIVWTDTSADSSIVGNTILYTTGGVLPDVNAPATNVVTSFDARLWMIAAETGALWYSKTVIPATPVEMSSYQTLYVAGGEQGQVSLGQPQ
jgi:hypothetical protein